jgi:hypothetical protein
MLNHDFTVSSLSFLNKCASGRLAKPVSLNEFGFCFCFFQGTRGAISSL